jgi:hypothetical protein
MTSNWSRVASCMWFCKLHVVLWCTCMQCYLTNLARVCIVPWCLVCVRYSKYFSRLHVCWELNLTMYMYAMLLGQFGILFMLLLNRCMGLLSCCQTSFFSQAHSVLEWIPFCLGKSWKSNQCNDLVCLNFTNIVGLNKRYVFVLPPFLLPIF